MDNDQQRIANRVRGIAAEHNLTQQDVADTLELSRTSVNERYMGRVPFTATELLALARKTSEPVVRFYPEAAA